MNAPVLSAVSAHTSLQYRLSVSAPHTGGAGVGIDSYDIVFKHRDSETYEALGDCDGSLAAFVTNLYCDIDLSTLTGAPLNLQLGDPVIAKIRAVNVLGAGDYSADSDGTALVVSVPATPSASPYRHEASCTKTSITVYMPLIAGDTDTGGLPILSYKLEWDQGGSSWTALVGDTPASLATSYTVTGLTEGQAYSFRYVVRNEVGWSAAESPVLSTYSATVPGQMAAPTTAVDADTEVLISWTAPDAGGLTITSYAVDIRGVDGTYHLEATYCAVSTTSCSVPLLHLQGSPFNLELGDLAQAVVRATNLIGESPDSSHNTDGALVETVPSAPPVAPQRNAATTLSSLSVDYYALTGTSRGGTPVLSYELQWDQGASVGVWQELVGFSSDSLLNQFTVEDVSDPAYITSGGWYSFRYRAKNR